MRRALSWVWLILLLSIYYVIQIKEQQLTSEVMKKYMKLFKTFIVGNTWQSCILQFAVAQRFVTYSLKLNLSLLHTCKARVKAEADADAQASECECIWNKWSKSDTIEARISIFFASSLTHAALLLSYFCSVKDR